MTTDETREIARFFREKLAGVQRNSTWFGEQIGRSQSHASQILRGNKPMSVDELEMAASAFGLRASDVMLEAEGALPRSSGPAQSPDMASDPRSLLTKLLREPNVDAELVRRLSESESLPGVTGNRLKRLQAEIRRIRQGELERALAALPQTEGHHRAV